MTYNFDDCHYFSFRSDLKKKKLSKMLPYFYSLREMCCAGEDSFRVDTVQLFRIRAVYLTCFAKDINSPKVR